MKSCSKCNVALEKGDKKWKFQSAEADGVPGKTGYLCSKCFRDVNKARKANTKKSQSQKCVNCKAAFVKSRSNPETDGLCPQCHDVELGIAEPPERCLNCKSAFVKSRSSRIGLPRAGKGFYRRSKQDCGIPPEAFDGKDGFLCYKCITVVQKQLQLKAKRAPASTTEVSIKTRKKVVSVPLFYKETNKKMYLSKPRAKRPSGFKKEAMDDIWAGNYKQAFVTLVGKSKHARKVFYQLASQYITKEIKKYPKQGILSKSPMFDFLNFIPWADIVEEASSSMPFLVQVLKAALPDAAKWKNSRNKKQSLLGQKCLSAKKAKVLVDRRLGFILSVILFSLKPKMFSFIQGCISLQLRKQYHCGTNVMRFLNGMGVAKGLHGTLLLMEALKNQQQSSESSSKQMDQEDLAGASASPDVDLQSLIFKERSDGAEPDEDLDLVEQLLGVTSMDF